MEPGEHLEQDHVKADALDAVEDAQSSQSSLEVESKQPSQGM